MEGTAEAYFCCKISSRFFLESISDPKYLISFSNFEISSEKLSFCGLTTSSDFERGEDCDDCDFERGEDCDGCECCFGRSCDLSFLRIVNCCVACGGCFGNSG